MSVIMECNKNLESAFPDGKIRLMDGRLVDCYPKGARGETEGRKALSSADKREKELDKERFVKNAFYFLAHKERILTDSRMFLCPVPVISGMSVSGTSGFENPTLGVYLQWWTSCPGAMRTDKKGRKSLVYHFAGSNLSGANHCTEVREDGKTATVSLYPFSEHWRPFMKINNAYTEAKGRYQAYSIKQVLDILDREASDDMDYAKALGEAFSSHEINSLLCRVKRLEAENAELTERVSSADRELDEEKMLRFYAEYRALEVETGFELEILQQQKRDLKASLHANEISNELYQHRLLAINGRIKEIEQEISDFKFKEIRKSFPQGDVEFYQIQSFIEKRNANDTEKNHQQD